MKAPSTDQPPLFYWRPIGPYWEGLGETVVASKAAAWHLQPAARGKQAEGGRQTQRARDGKDTREKNAHTRAQGSDRYTIYYKIGKEK